MSAHSAAWLSKKAGHVAMSSVRIKFVSGDTEPDMVLDMQLTDKVDDILHQVRCLGLEDSNSIQVQLLPLQQHSFCRISFIA